MHILLSSITTLVINCVSQPRFSDCGYVQVYVKWVELTSDDQLQSYIYRRLKSYTAKAAKAGRKRTNVNYESASLNKLFNVTAKSLKHK